MDVKKPRLTWEEWSQLDKAVLTAEMTDILYRLRISEHRFDVFYYLTRPYPLQDDFLPKKKRRNDKTRR